MKIREKILVGFMSVFVLSLIVLGVQVGAYIYDFTRDMVGQKSALISQSREKLVETYIGGQRRSIILIASLSALKDYFNVKPGLVRNRMAKGEVERLMNELIESGSGVSQVELLNSNGEVVMSMGVSKSKQEYVLSVPVLGDGGKVVGTIVTRNSPTFVDIYSANGMQLVDPLYVAGRRLLLGVGLVGVMFLLVGWMISGVITKPLMVLTDVAKKFSGGDFSVRTNIRRKDELGMLTKTFDEMADEVVASRRDLDRKVEEQTRDIKEKSRKLEEQHMALEKAFEAVEKEKEVSTKSAQDMQKFRLAVENASDHVVITDAEGITLYVNRGFERITGFSVVEVVGKKAGTNALWGGQMGREFYEKMWKTIKEEKQLFVGEIKNRRKDGNAYWAYTTISPILNEKGEVIFFVDIERDVTREKEVDRMKTEFISLASHQLRTPLSAMKWFSEMLLSGDAGELSGEQKDFVKNIYESNDRMISLVNALLNISRIESGRIMIDPKPTDLSILIGRVVSEIKPLADAKKQALVVNVHDSLPLVNLDEKMIMEVYKNLLTNSIKYTANGGEIVVIVSRKDNELVSQVSDNGYGIPEKDQARIFEKFFRAGNTQKLETDGTGLGLYLVKSIVESSGGKIWFRSEENSGTSFWFSLPIEGMHAKTGEVSING